MSDIQFNTEFEFEYGRCDLLSKGIRRVVARNPSPFTFHGTGTYIIGEGEVAVIDPGPALPDHIEGILQATKGETISHILITHTHADHSPGARLLKAKCDAVVLGFGPHARETAGALEGGVDRDFVPDFSIKDGEIISMDSWSLEAILTPGHCSNHLCFADTERDVIFCGDQLMAWSTTVILPPDGSVKAYLDSLDKLAARPESLYWPTHGACIPNPDIYIKQIRDHRLSRIAQVKRAIAQGLSRIPDIRALLYQAVPPSLYAGAELSILASIHYLLDAGEVRAQTNGSIQDEFFLT